MRKCSLKKKSDLEQLCHQLGEDYSIRRIDFENCLYCDFGNGFDVEISGVEGSKKHNPTVIFLWGPLFLNGFSVVTVVGNVPRTADDIRMVVEDLKAFSDRLLLGGYDENNQLIHVDFKGETNYGGRYEADKDGWRMH